MLVESALATKAQLRKDIVLRDMIQVFARTFLLVDRNYIITLYTSLLSVVFNISGSKDRGNTVLLTFHNIESSTYQVVVIVASHLFVLLNNM